MRNKKMTFPEYLHEMPLNRIIYRKRVIKHAKKVFTQFYTCLLYTSDAADD